MSGSGILFTIFHSAAYGLMAAGHSGWGWVMVAISWPFMMAAIYHNEQQKKRIAALEKELDEMRKDGG